MKLTKEQFVGIVDGIVKQISEDKRISKAVDDVIRSGDNRGVVYTTPLIDSIVDNIDDEFNTVSWWLWDGPDAGKNADEFKIQYKDGAQRSLHNAGELYEYMEENN